MNNLPYVVQNQINKSIDEGKVQKINTNIQEDNVKDLSFSNSSKSTTNIKPEPPKVSYFLKVINKNTFGVNFSAPLSIFDDVGSARSVYGDTYSIIRDGVIIKENIAAPLSYIDTNVEYGMSYSYQVIINTLSGLSNSSSQIQMSVIDSSIPHTPDNFTVYFDNPKDIDIGTTKIKFNQNMDEDYKGMRIIYKESNLADTEWKESKFVNQVGDQGSEATTLISGLVKGKYYDFAIQAMDYFGNVSEINKQESVRLFDNVAPNPVNNFSAALMNSSPIRSKLSWTVPVPIDGISDTTGYKIQRAAITTGQQIYSDLTTINSHDTLIFEDSTVESGTSYIYRISSFDENNNMSDYTYSDIIKIESISNSIDISVQYQNAGETTFPITVTATNIPTTGVGNTFAIVINKKSTGLPISLKKIASRVSSSIQTVSIVFSYTDLLEDFVKNISSETFLANDFEIRFYERITIIRNTCRFVDLFVKDLSIDFRPPAVQNFLITYDAKNKKIYMSWDKPSFSILSGYVIKYSGKTTQKTWDNSTLVKEIFISDTLNTVIDVPPDINLNDPQTLSYFSIKSISKFNFSYISANFTKVIGLSNSILSSSATFNSLTIYGKLPAVTGQVVIGGAQEVNIKFTPLDLEGVSEYWIYASYTASDLDAPTDEMIEWKGKASIANIKKIAGVEIPNEIRTIYFKMLAVDYQQIKGTISDLFSGISHDSMVPEYTVSFSPNIIVEKLISGNSLSVSLISNDDSGFSATGALYVSLDDGEFIAKTYTRSNENKTITYSETFSSIADGEHKICFKVFDVYNNLLTTQWYPFEVDISVPSTLPAPYILKDNAFVQTQQIALSSRTYLPLTGISESIDIFNSKTVQVCLPEFTTCSNFSHIKMFIAQYNISTSSYGSYVEIKMPQSANLDSNAVVSDFKATVTFEEDIPDFKIKMIQVKKNVVIGDINFAIASSKNKIDTTPPLIKVNSMRYENDASLENVANNNYINSRIINGGLIIDLTIIETNSGLWSSSIDVENLRMPVYYQVNGGAKTPLLEYGSPMFKSPFFIPKEKFSSFGEGEKVTITIYAMDNALKIGSLNIVKIMNKVAPDNVTSQKAIFGIESNKPVIKISYTKPFVSDLAGIRLYESGVLIKETLGEVMSIPTSSGSDRAFVLKSVDVADNESSGVSFTAHNYAPSTVTGLNAESDINALSLSWNHVITDTNGDLMTDLKYYEVSYSKWDGVIVEKTVSNRFLIQLSKEDMTYYNANQSISITDIKIRAIDYFDLAGSYCTPTTGRPRFIEAVDMTDNVFKFVGTSNRFTGDLTNLFDNSFRGWSIASVISDDWVQVDMLKPDFISEMKLKFYGGLLSASTAIRFIMAYYDCSTSTKAWKYISASNSSHDIGTAVDRQTDETTARSRYFEYTITKADQGTEEDKLNAFSISMLKTGLSKATFYASTVKIIFLSACADLGFTAFLPKTRSIYNEFYGDIMYLSSMAAIRSSEDPDTYMTLDKEKLTLTKDSNLKLKLGKLYDDSYGLWAYDNVLLGGSESAPQMRVNTTEILIGGGVSGYYSSRVSGDGIQAGYSESLSQYNISLSESYMMIGALGSNLYASKFSTSKVLLGYIPAIDDYLFSADFASSLRLSMRSNEIGNPIHFEVGAYTVYDGGTPYIKNTVWSKSMVISDDRNSILYEAIGTSLFISKYSLTEQAVRIYGGYSGTQTVEQYITKISGTGNLTTGLYSSSGYAGLKGDGLTYGIWGLSSAGIGLFGYSNSGYGIKGQTESGYAAIYGYTTGSGAGLTGESTNGYGVSGDSDNSYGGYFSTSNGAYGLYALSGKSNGIGIYGEATSYGIWGHGYSGPGIYATTAGYVSLRSAQKTELVGDTTFSAQIYALSMAAGVGTHAVKWNNATGQLTYDNSSSLRYKHDIERLSFDINQYNNILPSKFKYNYDNSNDIGFIAEEMATLFPDIVVFDKNGQPDAIKYDRISVYNVLANQYNNKKIQELEKQISELKTLVDQLLNK